MPSEPPQERARPSRRRRWLALLHAAALLYVAPAFVLAGRALAPDSLAFAYRASAEIVAGVFVACWNIAYWFLGFYPRIYRLSPEVQARTGAKVRIRSRSIEWDRPVGWRAALGLQLRFLGLLAVAFAVWGVLVALVLVLFVGLEQGLPGVVTFFAGK